MRWLPAVLAIIETVSRVVDRIGPIQFEPMEKHPVSAAGGRTPSMTVDPPADYDPSGLNAPFNDDDGNGVDDGLEP